MATSDVAVDFHAIVKAYFQSLQERHIKSNNLQARNQAFQQSQMMAPDLSNLKLICVANDDDWDDRSNVMAATAFAKLTRDVKWISNPGKDVSGHIQAVAPSDKGNDLKITKGRIAGRGWTLMLPLPRPVRNALKKSELPINPGEPEPEENKIPRDPDVTRRKSWDAIPSGGAGAQVVSEESFRYEGRFSCMVFPEGKCMLQRADKNIGGGEPDIQKIIHRLKKNRSNPSHQALVKNFLEEGNDYPDSTVETESRYFWKLEGYYAVNTGSKLALK